MENQATLLVTKSMSMICRRVGPSSSQKLVTPVTISLVARLRYTKRTSWQTLVPGVHDPEIDDYAKVVGAWREQVSGAVADVTR